MIYAPLTPLWTADLDRCFRYLIDYFLLVNHALILQDHREAMHHLSVDIATSFALLAEYQANTNGLWLDLQFDMEEA